MNIWIKKFYIDIKSDLEFYNYAILILLITSTEGKRVFFMEIKNYCPIIIGTLNRFEHFKRCVESLQRCEMADKTEIYISVDYPFKKEHEAGHKKIVDYLKRNPLAGFKETHVFYQGENLGVSNNYNFLIEKLPDYVEWFISFEDDNEFSAGFLKFLNTSVEIFKNDSDFYGVCAYSRLKNIDKQCWYKSVELTYGNAQSKILRRNLISEINEIYNRRLSMKELFKIYKGRSSYVENYADYLIHDSSVYYNADGKIRNIDYTVGLCVALTDKYVVQPTISYVRNYGCDGSGVNSVYDADIYNKELYKKMYDKSDFICEREFEVSRDYINNLNKNWDSFIESAKGWIKILLIKILGLSTVRKMFNIKNGLRRNLRKEG